MDLQYSEIEGPVRLIKLNGRLDTVGAGQIETKFAGYCSGDQVRVIVDLAEVDFLASIGIRLLLLNAKSIARRGGKMALLDPIPDVEAILELTAVSPLIAVCHGLAAAQEAVQT